MKRQLSCTTLSASTASDNLRWAALSALPTKDSRPAVVEKERKADLIEALNIHKIAFNKSKVVLEEETISRGVVVSALGALENRGRSRKAEKFSIN